MRKPVDPLLRHLLLAVLIKLVVLTLLWWAFVREQHRVVDAEAAAARLQIHQPMAAPAPMPEARKGEPR